MSREETRDFFEAVRDLYSDWKKAECWRDGCTAVRLPDFEAALDKAELEGTVPLA